MSGHSNKTVVLTIRLPRETLETLQRRADKNGVTLREYLQTRIVYDIRRKHRAGKEIQLL